MEAIIPVRRLNPRARLPEYGSAGAAGADLRACLDGPVTVAPGETVMLPTGLAVALPAGTVGLVFARSGLACRDGLAPANKVGVIDADYRGELRIALHNHGREPKVVEDGMRVAQLVVVPCVTGRFLESGALDETARGEGGFGSTGLR